MERLLDTVNSPADIKKLSFEEKRKLAEEYRKKIIETVANNGGHLASNLGVVELTIALHSVFDVPKDKIIWDVGHQTYTHKMITGRKEQFDTLRKKNGIAGFPKISESNCDCFNTGHSGTSISAALGVARARDIKKEEGNVIAVIGDGALTGGIALEALNDAGSSNTKLIVILNDNEMSISKNVGGISTFLGKMRAKKIYKNSNKMVKNWVLKIPKIGNKIVEYTRKIKYSIKHLFISNMFFEDIGFKYFGPIDGHDTEKIEGILKLAKEINEPVLIHIITKKGKGYLPAEEKPEKFHGVSPFHEEDGTPLKEKQKDYSAVFGEKLVKLAESNSKIVAITAAMRDGTGLKEFSQKFPERFFDVGIAEQHAVCFAAGIATNGMLPVIPIYASFYQRAYDQIIHDICIQNLPVILCSDRAGIVGQDGETHQGILDLAFCRVVPNLTIMAPKDFEELERMLEFAVDQKKPMFLRYPRGTQTRSFTVQEKIDLGKPEIIEQGEDITIIAIGNMVARATEVSEILKKQKISCEVINARFLKPLQEEALVQSIQRTGNVITIEDGVIMGGLGTVVQEIVVKWQLENRFIKAFGYPDKFIPHATVKEIEEQFGLSAMQIAQVIQEELERKSGKTRNMQTV